MKKKNFQDDYQVITQIGKGGYGTIYKVQAKYTGVLRAAKIIKKTTLAQDDLERLLIEMSIMIDLDHPNIARLFEVYDYKLHFVLIVELCEGGELFKKIALRKMD
jgi:calcium-dependent protein kinase